MQVRFLLGILQQKEEMMKHIREFGVIYAGIFAVLLIVSGAFLIAYEQEKEKVDCIEAGYVYIDDHCYRNLPIEVMP
jgi:hypothetical protein